MEDYKAIFYSKKCDGKRGGHTVDELKVICRALNLKVSGTKQVLCDRITEYLTKKESQTSISVSEPVTRKKSVSKIETKEISNSEIKIGTDKLSIIEKKKNEIRDYYQKNKSFHNFLNYILSLIYLENSQLYTAKEIKDIKINHMFLDSIVINIQEFLTFFYTKGQKYISYPRTGRKENIEKNIDEYQTRYNVLLQRLYKKYEDHDFEVLEVNDSEVDNIQFLYFDNDSGQSTSRSIEESQESILSQIQSEIKEVNIKKTIKTNKTVKSRKSSKPEKEESVDIHHQLRKKNIEFLIKILSINTSLPIDKIKEIVLEIERGIYETSVSEDYYKQRALFIINNLNPKNKAVKNKQLIVNLLDGTIEPYQLGASISAQELMPERYIKSEIVVDQKQLTKEEIEALPDSPVACFRCRSKKNTYTTRQIRASDEPETKFFYCYNCENRWKTNN